jgi:hypothetical protein
MPAEQRRRYKFTASFDQVFRSEDVEVICCAIGRLGRALAKRWVGTARCEVLDHQLKRLCQALRGIDPGTRRCSVISRRRW